MKSISPAIAILVVSALVQASDYYVDSVSGNDKNAGTQASPWKTISKVNSVNLVAGDRVFFKGGASFSGTLTPKTAGASGKPITFGSYGTGRATISAGNSTGASIKKAYITIDGLNVVGSGRTAGNTGNGIYVNANNVIVKNADVSGFQHNGVYVYGSSNTRVEYVNAHDNGHTGIMSMGSGTWNNPAQYHTNQYYGNCKVYNNPGDPTVTNNWTGSGIVIAQVNGATIEYVEAYNNGWDQHNTAGNGPAGIWCWQADNVTIQYCISHDNKTQAGKGDGDGFDFDGGTRYSTMQYCLSYNNVGPGYLLCQFSGASAWDGNTIRYCISRNDGSQNGKAALLTWNGGGTFQNAKVYNNVFYNDFGYANNFYNNCTGSGFYNNIFITKNSTCTPNSGSGMTYQGNCYLKIGGGFSLDGYTSLSSWAAAKNQEKVNGVIVGINADPLLTNPGAAITLTDPTKLSTLTAFQLLATSPCINKGLNLQSLFGLNPGTRDFFGNSIPQASAFDMGAHESTAAANAAPTVATAAKATPSPVTGMTTALSVLGADDGGEAALTYTWAATTVPTGATPTFSANGTNAAKNSTVTFNKAGNYAFTVTIKDAGNLTVTSSVNVTVSQTLTSIVLSPTTAALVINATQQFTATGRDQFAASMATQPSFTWSIATGGVGSVSSTGLYSAGAATGSTTVRATSGTISGTASVTVAATNTAPLIISLPWANPNPVTTTQTTLSVMADDDGGPEYLTYTWAATSAPSGATPTFSPNGTNAAENSVVTFNKAGTYTFQVTVRDAGGLTATGSVSVTVNQTLTSIVLSPTSASLAVSATQQFTATARDQFAANLTAQPAFTWTIDAGGVGSVSTSGLYSAGAVAGTAKVRATSGSVSGTATVTVTSSNLIPNPGFESGTTPWSYQGASRLTGEAYAGSYCGKATGTNVGIWQTVTGLKPSTTYVVRAYGKIGTAGETAFIYAKYFGGTEQQGSFTTTTYTQRTLTITTGATNTSVELGLWKSAGTGSAWVDNFELIQQ